MLGLTNHAVEQFISRWRPESDGQGAEAELQTIANNARPLRSRTDSKDARLYMSVTPAGERIPLVVRDGLIITVLPERRNFQKEVSADLDLYEESRHSVTALRNMIAEEQRIERELRQAEEEQRWAEATSQGLIQVVVDWQAGKRKDPDTRILGIFKQLGITPFDPLPGQTEIHLLPFHTSEIRNAFELVRAWRASGKLFKSKPVRRAHELLLIPCPEVSEEERCAQSLIDDWKAGRVYPGNRALFKALTLLGLDPCMDPKA